MADTVFGCPFTEAETIFPSDNKPNDICTFLFTNLAFAGFSIVMGTYVERKMEQFLKSPKSSKTDIDELVLFEQRVNLINLPVILMQLLWIVASGSKHTGWSIRSCTAIC